MTLSLDKITEVENKIHFHNERLQSMLYNVKEYSNSKITYHQFSKTLENMGFSFMNEKGGGKGKILVSDRRNVGEKWMFLY